MMSLTLSLICSLDGQLNSYIYRGGEIDADRWGDRYPPQKLPHHHPVTQACNEHRHHQSVRGWWLKYAPPLALSDVFIMNRNISGQPTSTCQHAQILYVYTWNPLPSLRSQIKPRSISYRDFGISDAEMNWRTCFMHNKFSVYYKSTKGDFRVMRRSSTWPANFLSYYVLMIREIATIIKENYRQSSLKIRYDHVFCCVHLSSSLVI